VRPHGLTSPLNDSERLISHLTSDTPIRLDCRGRPYPGLAAAWSGDSTGRVWTLTLRQDARRYDGAPVMAQEIVRAWNGSQAIQRSVAIESAVELDDKRISIILRQPQDSVPEILADPAFSLAIDPAQGPVRLNFDSLANGDPRDALDRGADLVVSRDPALVEYASARPELITLPLPWNRTYVLLEPADQGNSLVQALGPTMLRESLARDAVRADARPAEPPFWWNDVANCPMRSEPPPGPRSSRVVYLQGDEVARGLADRIVALTAAGTGLRTAALEADELSAALLSDSERAYILAAPRKSLAPCRDLADWPVGASILPLIDTRASAIVRRGAPPLVIEWDGSVGVDDAAMREGSR
jgi:hypothetical protein